jgi:hypothetical protein
MRNDVGDPCKCRLQAWSHDMGRTFEMAREVPELKDPSCQGSTISTQSGPVHVLWLTHSQSDPPDYLPRTNGQLHASLDGGLTW